MSFTYKGDPSASAVDAVRFLLGDTNEETHVFEDEEIEWALTQETDYWFAAAICADAAVAKYALMPTSQTIGETSITYGERTTKYNLLAFNLRNNRRQGAVAPWGSGWSKSSKSTFESDDDREEIVAKKTTVPDSNIVGN